MFGASPVQPHQSEEFMTFPVIVDAAGGQVGGAARFRTELHRYVNQTGRHDIRVVGADRQVSPAWLARREAVFRARDRRISLNNVSFVTPGSQRWTLLRNPLDFLTDQEFDDLAPALRAPTRRRASVIHLAARRSDVLVVPSTAMAHRVAHRLPSLRSRVVVRHHPVSADSIPDLAREPAILCPVLFSPFKGMAPRLAELLAALDDIADEPVRLRVTANPSELPEALAQHRRIELIGRISHQALRQLWARSQAIYFPPGIESFGYPLAEARVSGQPVIARDTAQNQEIAGPALRGFTIGDAESLRAATKRALTEAVAPDPGPFDPSAYFDWLLGDPR
jgi:glycosyltransferase involved in cell wall biosynthesis